MKISIVTPCFDRPDYLNQTIESVLMQSGEFSLEYIVQNAGDSAEVQEILDRWTSHIESGAVTLRCRDLRFLAVNERDTGMYDGINRGFARCSGEVMAWINSDDLYHPGALQTVGDAFSQNPNAYWIAGIANSFNSRGSRTGFDEFPRAYSREFIKKGLYRIENSGVGLTWIPQDCVFWKRNLWNSIGARLDERYKYAADFHLWQSFAKHAELIKLYSFLGGYRFHGNQFTANPALYLSELPPNGDPPQGWRNFYKILTALPSTERLVFNAQKGRLFLPFFDLKWEWLVGHVIKWSFDSNRWEMSLSRVL